MNQIFIHSGTAVHLDVLLHFRLLANQLPGDASGAGVVPHDSGHAISSTKEGDCGHRPPGETSQSQMSPLKGTVDWLISWDMLGLILPNLLWIMMDYDGLWRIMLSFWGLGKRFQPVSWDGIGVFLMAHLGHLGTRYPEKCGNRSSASDSLAWKCASSTKVQKLQQFFGGQNDKTLLSSGEWRESLGDMVVSNLFRLLMGVEFPNHTRQVILDAMINTGVMAAVKTHGVSPCRCHSHTMHTIVHHKHSCILSRSPCTDTVCVSIEYL